MSEQMNEILNARGQQYGDFAAMSNLSQQIRAIFMGAMQQHNPDALQVFRPYMAEAVQMFATKLARIACGNPFHEDSWRDIAGYAELVANKVAEEMELGRRMYEQQIAEQHRQAEAAALAQAEAPELASDGDPVHPGDLTAGSAGEKAGESDLMVEHTHLGYVGLREGDNIDEPVADVVQSVEPTQPTPHVDGNI